MVWTRYQNKRDQIGEGSMRKETTKEKKQPKTSCNTEITTKLPKKKQKKGSHGFKLKNGLYI